MIDFLKIASLFLFFCCYCACKNNGVTQSVVEEKTEYLFLGHTYFKENRVDPRLETIDYSKYKGLWLGGDMCSETTKERATLEYLDDLFDLDSEDTHWAVGNHDVRNGNIDWIREFTGRDLYYTHTKDGLTIVVLDTNMGLIEGRGASCEDRIAQTQFFENLLDTIQFSSHLVILGHWAIWGGVKPEMHCYSFANACAPYFEFLCDDPASKFPNLMYEKMVAVEQKGVEVLFVTGDGGIYSKQYHFQTEEGIDFLISGLYSTLDRDNPPTNVQVNLNPDSVLIFNHLVEEQRLDWKFVNLDELVAE